MAHTSDLVAKLWNLCNILKDDGVSFQNYATELTYLLFLKMAEETGKEDGIPARYRWAALKAAGNDKLLGFYGNLLLHLGEKGRSGVKEIFRDAQTSLRQSRHLRELITGLDALDWYAAREDGALADLYEGLLEKNSSEIKGGAGQYFTPRPLIDSIVSLLKPRPGEVIQDPAAGTGGFLIAADRFIRGETGGYSTLSATAQKFQLTSAYVGAELVPDTHRMGLMNLYLHGVKGHYKCGDTLGSLGESLPPADVMLTNPPFGTKRGGGLPSRTDFTFQTSNKQLCFLQHIYRGLKPGGRAGVVIPDLQGYAAPEVLVDLMDKCDLHTVLRLPTGIFYAQGVKTNVYFFTRGKTDTGNTKRVWIYDLRSNMPTFNKGNPLTRSHFADFEKAFGSDRYGKSNRKDDGEQGRFRCFDREYIRDQGNSLDITWLNENDGEGQDKLASPDTIALRIESKLKLALQELGALVGDVKSPR
jgi:type I restriction enzyme M protein